MNEIEAFVASAKNYDGDTVYDGEGQGYRLTNIDTPEMDRPNGENSRQAFIELVRGGGQLKPTGQFDKYGRELTDFVDERGDSLTRDMIQGGLGGPTSFSDTDHKFAPVAGNIRQALGLERTENDVINAYAKRRKVDPNLVRNVVGNRKGYYDRRGTGERSWDRGTAELKMSLGGAINYLGDRLDSDVMRDYGRDMFIEAELDTSLAGREVETFNEIDSLDDAMTYGMETIGEALPGFLVDAGAAAVTGGASLVGSVARRGAMKTLASGGAKGAGLSAGVQSGGAMEAQLEMQGSEDNPYAPIFQGGVTAGMTALPVGIVLDRVLGKVSDEGVKRKLGESVIGAFKTAGIAGAVEAPTSAVDAFSNQVIESIALGKETEIDYQLIVDEAMRGTFGGAVMGGGMDGIVTGVDAAYQAATARAKSDKDGNITDGQNNMQDEDGNYVPVPENNDPMAGKVYDERQAAERSVSGGAMASMSSADIPDLASADFSQLNQIITGSDSVLEPGGELMPPSVLKSYSEQGYIPIEDENGNEVGQAPITENDIVQYLADYRHEGRFALDSSYNYRKEFAVLENEVLPEVLDVLSNNPDKRDELATIREDFKRASELVKDTKNEHTDQVTGEYREAISALKKKFTALLGKDAMRENGRDHKATDFKWEQSYQQAYAQQENARRDRGEFKPNAEGEESLLQRKAREEAEQLTTPGPTAQRTSAREALNTFTERLKSDPEVKAAVTRAQSGQPLQPEEKQTLGAIEQELNTLKGRAAEEESQAQRREQPDAEPDAQTPNLIETLRSYVSELEQRGTGARFREVHHSLDMYEAAERIVKRAVDARHEVIRQSQNGGEVTPEAHENLERAERIENDLMETWLAEDVPDLMGALIQNIEVTAKSSKVKLDPVVQGISNEAMARDALGEATTDEDAANNADWVDTEEQQQADQSYATDTPTSDNDTYEPRVADDFNSLDMLEGLGLEVSPELKDRVAEPNKAEKASGAQKNTDIQPKMSDTFFTDDKELATRGVKGKVRHVSPTLIDAINEKLANGEMESAVSLLQKNGLVSRPGTERQKKVERVIRKSRGNLHRYQTERAGINEEAEARTEASNEKNGTDKKPFLDKRSDAGVTMIVPVADGAGKVSMERVELDGWEVTKMGAQSEGIDLDSTRWGDSGDGDYLRQLEKAFLTGLQMIAGEGVNHNGVDYFGQFDANEFSEHAVIGRIEGMDATTWGSVKRQQFSQSRSRRANSTKVRISPTKGGERGLPRDKAKAKRVFVEAMKGIAEQGTAAKKPYDMHSDDWQALKNLLWVEESILKNNGVNLYGRPEHDLVAKDPEWKAYLTATYEALKNGAGELDRREYLVDQADPDAEERGELYRGAESSLDNEAEVQEAEGFAGDTRTRLTKRLDGKRPQDVKEQRAKLAKEAQAPIRADGSHRAVNAERGTPDPEFGDAEPDNLSQSERIKRERAIVKASKRKGNARKPLLRFLHTLNSRIGNIHPEMGKKVESFLNEKEVAVNRAVTKLNTLFRNKRRGADQLQKAYRDLQSDKDTPEATKLKSFIEGIEAELQEADPSYEPTGKVPTVIDFAEVANKQSSFKAILREAGIDDPDTFAEQVLESRGSPDMHYSPTGDPTRRSNDELLPAIDKLREAGFVVEDAPTIMTRYAFAAMSRAEWSRAVGGYDKGGNWRPNGTMTEMLKEVHPGNREEMNNLLLGATGRLNLHHSRGLRAFNSIGMAFQTMTVLLFSGIASIPELGVMYSRSRELNGLGGDVRKVLSKQGREDMYQFAADYGIAVDQTIKHTLSSLYSMDELTFGRFNEKVSDVMFKLNGQAALTHMNRVMAAEIGKRMLTDHARKSKGGSRASDRMLAELGIEADTVLAHNENPDPNTPEGKEFGKAIGRFVNESVTNPHAGQLPLIASDPRFILLTSLKKFFYGFYNNVHKSLFNEYRSRRGEGRNAAEALSPVILTAALMLPLAAFAEMLRELVKDPTNDNSQDWAQWARRSALATGGLGPFQAAQSAYDATGYGRNFLVSLAGPTADFLTNDVATGEFLTKRPARMIPGVNQLPWARSPVNKTWKELISDGEY